MTGATFPEFGMYALPGHTTDLSSLATEVRTAEDLGLGSIWLSERLNTKNVEVLSGFAAAITTRLQPAA